MGTGTTAVVTDDRVCGVLRSKIDPKAVDRALDRLDIVPASSTKLEGKVELLHEHYQAVPNAAEVIGPCDVCGGESDPNDGDECPYCGTKEGAASASADVGDPPDSGELSDEDDPVPGNDDEDVELGEAVEAAVTEPAPAPAAAAPPSPASPDQKLVQRPKGARKVAKKAAKEAKANGAHANGASTAMMKAQKGAVVQRDPKPENVIENQAEGLKILDAKVAEIRSIDREKTWALITKLGEVFNSQLWKLRTDPEGKPKYTVFEDFCLEELDFTRQYVQQMIQIGARFTEKELIEHGVTKLRAVLSAPPQKQAEAFERLKEGATRREIEKAFQKTRPVGPKSKKTKAKTRTSSSRDSGSLTIAVTDGMKTVKLFKKPASKDAPQVRAKRLADIPHGYVDLENDVRLWITVGADRDGELIAKIAFRRESPTE